MLEEMEQQEAEQKEMLQRNGRQIYLALPRELRHGLGGGNTKISIQPMGTVWTFSLWCFAMLCRFGTDAVLKSSFSTS